MPVYAVGIVPLHSIISLGRSDNERDRTYHVAYLAGGLKIFDL